MNDELYYIVFTIYLVWLAGHSVSEYYAGYGNTRNSLNCSDTMERQ